MNLSAITAIVGGVLHGQDALALDITTDTRSLTEGALFIAIVGEQYDGHDWVSDAKSKGACGVLVTHQLSIDLPQIIVHDTIAALGEIARHHRRKFNLPVCGITGSCGKTTVKNMLAAILSISGNTLATEANFNNAIGVPLTLLRLMVQDRFAVIEIGTDHPGEIAYGSSLAEPNIVLINNIAAAHLSGLKTVEKVADEKADIIKGLQPGGKVVLNADDDFFDLLKSSIGAFPVISFGVDQAADVTVSGEITHEDSGSQFQIQHAGMVSDQIHLKALGRHNVANALAASAVAIGLGLSLGVIVKGLLTYSAASGRLSFFVNASGATIIDDTYNANPLSVMAAINVLVGHAGQKILVLGDMHELGDKAISYHRQMGGQAKSAGVDLLLACGELSQETIAAFGENGIHCGSHAQLLEQLKPLLTAQTVVLVKGSRASRMDVIVNGLTEN